MRAKDHLLSWAKDLYKDRYYIKAVKLFDISKAFLDDDAHFMLGFCYEEGKGGLSPNHEKAKEQYAQQQNIGKNKKKNKKANVKKTNEKTTYVDKIFKK